MRRLRPLLRDDRGIALPIVVMLAVVMVIAISAGLTTALSGLRQAATKEDRSAAYDAAYAGVQDYLVRINADSGYGQYGNAGAAFSAGSTFVTGPANPAFGINASGTWASVQTGTGVTATCTTGALTPCFRYAVDNRKLAAAGLVRLQSTGRVGLATRTIVVEIKRRGFVNYLWFTDYEVQDPALSARSECAVHAWETTAAVRSSNTCRISFAATDVLSGPVHSNDTIAVTCGATFRRQVTTADPRSTNWDPGSCATSPFQGGGPTTVAKVDMPPTNTAMRAQTRSDLVANPGCLYTGPTVVKYLGNGQMTVWSPWTRFTNITASTSTGSNPSKCGTPGSGSGNLGSSTGATVDELDQNLLYVQTVPPAPDPNYTATTAIPGGMNCYGTTGTNTVGDAAASVGWKFGPWAFPMAGEAAPDGWDGTSGISGTTYWSPSVWSTSHPAYNCRNGDLYVFGTVKTQTTAASDDYVYVIDDLKYLDRTQDVLGLVGNNAVLVWNPINASNKNLLAADTDREIDAAVLSVGHTFQVQNYNLGAVRGTLTLLGSIAQEFRGTVATASGGVIQTGYRKDYQYDDLLENVSPPYFLAPLSTTYVARLYMSTSAAWKSTGAAS